MIEEDNAQLRRRPVIRVFVSSTFTDLKHERDALQRDVFPKLEQLCASRQFQFQAIDLRWGVPTEASLDHRTMQICFEELRRSQEISPQPNFLILLGNRYGWRPLPEEVSEDEFRKLEQAASSMAARDILSAWYRRDENAVPPVHLLQSRKQNLNDGGDYTNDQVWNEVQRVLWDVINHAYPADQLAGRFDNPAALDAPLPAVVRFQASATEQEIWRGALGVPNASQHVLAFVREIENIEEFQRPVEIKDFVDVDESGAIDAVSQDALRKLKEQLRTRLGEGNVIGIEHARLTRSTNEKGEPSIDVTDGHLEELCARVQAALEAIIHRQINEYWGTSGSDIPSARELEIECLEHQRFGQERAPAGSFVGRERHLQAIKAYLLNDSHAPLVIHGASGCGKTALLARAAQAVAPRWKPVVRFIGMTPRSSDIRSLLASLCQELRQRHPLDNPLPGDVHELTRELQEHFNAAAAHEPLILFLDALDQLADAENGRSLFWIPFGPLPSHVKLIVSCLSDRAPEDPVGQPYAALKRRGLAEEDFINLDALSQGEAQTLLFERWFPQAKRRLNHEQAQRVRERLTSDACRLPLYLKVLFEEARLWRSYVPAPPLDDNVSELLGALFKRLGDKGNHGEMVECALGYIASARRGLTEMEILEVLYRDPDYKKLLEETAAKTRHKLPDDPQRIPIAIWSRLRFDLAPYLAEHGAPGGTVLSFYHRQVGEYVRGRVLDTPLKRQKRHERLAEYFQGQDYFRESLEAQRIRARTAPPTPRPVNVRKVDELPWQRLEAAKLNKQWEDLEGLFIALPFLEAKAEAGMVFELVTELSAATLALPRERAQRRILALVDEAIRHEVHFLARHPTTVFQCLWNACWWYDCPEAARHYEAPQGGWLEPPPWEQHGPQKLHKVLEDWRRAKEAATPGFLWLRSRRPPPVHLGTALKRVLHGHNDGVMSVAASTDGQRIVSGSGDNTVRVWDAASGAELRTLRGHANLVASVAVGADGQRIVSGSWDGTVRVWDSASGAELRVLRGHEDSVCGVALSTDGQCLASGYRDGTVRVWDAASGAELRILRGHGWVMSVAASADGQRIASGFRDGTVRVWDAASGAELCVSRGHELSVNSVALSGDGHQIVSGSDDQTVQVWDTSTGGMALKRILRGHKFGVTSVAVSADGRLIVSGSWDRTVRVWDAAGGAELRILRGHEGGVTSVAMSGDGQRIVSGSLDQTVRVWDAVNGTARRALRGHEGEVWGVGLSQDGQRIVSGSFDEGTRRLWDVDTGECQEVIRNEHALPTGPETFPFRLLATGGQTVIEDARIGQAIARFPAFFKHRTAFPSGRAWAGSSANHLYIITLEGGEDSPKSKV